MSIEFKAKIDVLKVLKQYLFQGKSGKYLDIVCFVNKDGKTQYGDDGFIVQEISKEARQNGEKGPIIGNWRWMEEKPKASTPAPAPKAAPEKQEDPDSDIPF
jgi:hypothetical protein